MRKLTTYLVQGILLFAPTALTVYIIYLLMNTIDKWGNSFLEELLGFKVWGLGLIFILLFLTLMGYLCSTLLLGPVIRTVERILSRTPFVSIVYSSLKDLFSAFVSEKKKFNQPVLICFNPEIGLQRLGFITQKQLTAFGLEDHVAVYLPHSYNFSGNMYFIKREHVTLLEDLSSTEAMKFIVSGGVTELSNAKNARN